MSLTKIAFVTLYNPSEAVVENIEILSLQMDLIILIDNSNTDTFKTKVKIKNFQYLAQCKNLGLSKAFNIALRLDLVQKFDYLFFFDQDSTIPNNYADKMISEFENLDKKINIGCLGPEFFDTSSQKKMIPKSKHKILTTAYSVKSIITSGMLTKYSILEQIGFWNEEIFLDLADWDLCWRLLSKKYLVCMTSTCILHHTLGQGVKKVGFFSLKIGEPSRIYFQTKDCLQLLGKTYTPIKYKIRFLLMLTVRPILYFLFLNKKKERLIYFLSGLHDFIFKE